MSNSMSTIMVYEGKPIRRDGRDEFMCLTDMWKAAGEDPSKKPADWRRKEGAGFIEFIEESIMPSGHNECFRTLTGNSPKSGTWAHWQIALAYAKYLSPAFHVECNKIVRAYMQGQLSAAVPAPPPAPELPSVDSLNAYVVNCKVVGDATEWRDAMFKAVHAASSAISSKNVRWSWAEIHGLLRKRYGVVSYLRLPCTLMADASGFLDDLVFGRIVLYRGDSKSKRPRATPRAQLTLFQGGPGLVKCAAPPSKASTVSGSKP